MSAVIERMNDVPAVQAHGAITPMQMIQIAVQQGADIDKLSKLMDLQERWEKNEARKAFVAALSAFKASPPDLKKNNHVRFETSKGVTEYDHATLDHVSLTIGEALSKHDLSHRWDVEQLDGGAIKVTCVLTHVLGHSERTSLQAGKDDSGGKNNIQGIGSTVTYLQRYTLLAATGMAVKGMDNDGKGGKEDGPEADPEGKAALEVCGSLDALTKAWAGLTKEQRKTLGEVKEEMKRRIQQADLEASK